MHNAGSAEANGQPTLTPEQFDEIARATRLSRRIMRSAKFAAFNSTVLWIFAVLSLIGGLLHPVGYVLGVGLAAVGWNEGQGARGVRALDPRGVRRLVWNQWLVAILICGYAGWKLVGSLGSTSSIESQLAEAGIDPSQMPIDVASLQQTIGVAVYGSVIVGVLASQAWLAWFHGKRRGMIAELERECPSYAIDVLRAAA